MYNNTVQEVPVENTVITKTCTDKDGTKYYGTVYRGTMTELIDRTRDFRWEKDDNGKKTLTLYEIGRQIDSILKDGAIYTVVSIVNGFVHIYQYGEDGSWKEIISWECEEK